MLYNERMLSCERRFGQRHENKRRDVNSCSIEKRAATYVIKRKPISSEDRPACATSGAASQGGMALYAGEQQSLHRKLGGGEKHS